MSRRPRRWICCAVAVVAMTIASKDTRAETPRSDTETDATSQARAQVHFKHAKELYQSGAYREAEAELQSALALDPHGRDLVFNLAIVNEKLGQIDSALRYLHRYVEMDVTPAERSRADGIIRRLEGAKREIAEAHPTAPREEPPPPAPPQRGRADGAFVAATTIAIAGLATGAVFGVKALVDKPRANFVTGPGGDGSYASLVHAAQDAHREAIVCDVALGVGVVAAVTSSILYFARWRDAAPPPSATIAAAPLPHGGAMVLEGHF